MVRVIALMFFVALAAVAPAGAQQRHWLVGAWEGELRGIGQNPTGSKRIFTVRTVSPDGTSAQGTWGTEAGPAAISIAISGSTVTFTAPNTAVAPGNSYKLEHKNGVLEGSWTSSTGRSGGVTLTKK